jgi:hypothetical protein
MEISIFSCLLEVNWRFRGTCCLHLACYLLYTGPVTSRHIDRDIPAPRNNIISVLASCEAGNCRAGDSNVVIAIRLCHRSQVRSRLITGGHTGTAPRSYECVCPMPIIIPLNALRSCTAQGWYNRSLQWSLARGARNHLTSIGTKHRNRLNLEAALILALTKIRPRIEVLACQK